MKFTPYPFQQAAIDHATAFLAGASPGQRTLYSAPTGCGKSVIELIVQKSIPGCWIVSPREEIVAGMLDKLGVPDEDMLDHRICTPVRLRNRLLAGSLEHPKAMLYDEGHHHSAETWQQLDLLTGFCPSAAFTATPYRGSPKSTKEFLEFWGEPIPIITYQEACAEKYISMPEFSILPLVDDDVVDVRSGDFDVTSIDSVTVDRLGDCAEHARGWYSTLWDRPTVFALPSSTSCLHLQQELGARGLPSMVVSAATSKADRRLAFQATVDRVVALLHINILSEGVDLPLRRLVDLAPTLSPVKWVQQLGRITRPTDEAPPEYVCTNRNVMRHSYALEGAVKTSTIAESERAFGPTVRAHSRVLGLEAIGRFRPVNVKLLSGVNVYVYALSVFVNGVNVEYCCVVHPTIEPIWATKINTVKDGVKSYGNWLRCEPPNDLRGFASVGQRELSPKQEAWWKRSASNYGIDASQEVTRKNFQVLPVLADIGARLR